MVADVDPLEPVVVDLIQPRAPVAVDDAEVGPRSQIGTEVGLEVTLEVVHRPARAQRVGHDEALEVLELIAARLGQVVGDGVHDREPGRVEPGVHVATRRRCSVDQTEVVERLLVDEHHLVGQPCGVAVLPQ